MDQVFSMQDLKVVSALGTYQAATVQESDVVAVILSVASAECLSMPNTPWRKEKLTKRFVSFFESLMPDDLDQIVAHGNFQQAFQIERGKKTASKLRRLLLEGIYDARSEPLHEGLGFVYGGRLGGDTRATLLRSVVGYFAEAAILRYLQSPRSSLVVTLQSNSGNRSPVA